MDVKDLYEMELHERMEVNGNTDALRVVGGWIYETAIQDNNGWQITQVFVPEQK